MAPQTEFPLELLSQPPAARLAHFQHKVVAHPHLKETHQQLWQAIQQPSGTSLIFVFGPTGVGKTTLRCRLEQQLWGAGRPAMEQDPGHIPVVGLEVAVADADRYRWRDYYYRALVALDEPMLDHKIIPDHVLDYAGRWSKPCVIGDRLLSLWMKPSTSKELRAGGGY
jgi:hypothetical protein